MIRVSRNAVQAQLPKAALVGSSILLSVSASLAAQPAAPVLQQPSTAQVQTAGTVPAKAGTTDKSAAVRGAMLSITPLRVELDGANAAQTLWLSNSGARALVVQTRVFAWKQAGSEDQYAQSNTVIASPAIATIPPGQTQIVRMLRTGAVSSREQAFRISIDQLPDANAPESSAAATRLRFLVPMFVDRANAGSAKLEWKNTPGGVQLVNSGGRTARIAWIKLLGAGGQELPIDGAALRYVQPGNTALWAKPGSCTSGATRIVADIDEAKVDALLAPCS